MAAVMFAASCLVERTNFIFTKRTWVRLGGFGYCVELD